MKQELLSVDDIDLGVIVKKSDDDDGYLVNAGDADYTRCPMCGSPNIAFGETEPDNIFIYRTHACDECGTTWEERYDLVQIKINVGDLKIIEDT